MRRSFGGNRGMGGGGILRTVQKAVRAGVGAAAQDPLSHSTATTNNTSASAAKKTNKPTTSNTLSLSSSTISPPQIPISAFSTGPTLASCSSPVSSDGFDWECVNVIEDERAYGFYDDSVFGSVPSLPSMDEVQNAVSSLQQVIHPLPFLQFVKDRYAYATDRVVTDHYTDPFGSVPRVSSVGTELGALDWIEPTMQLYNPRTLQPHGLGRVQDAFRLLQTDASVQKMVVSLSSDKAVWDAVLSNKVVRELKESFDAAETNVPESSDKSSGDSNVTTTIIQWIFNSTKAKVTQVIEKITNIVNELFPPPDSGETSGGRDLFEEKLRTSFRLAIVVMFIVVVTRAHAA